MGTKFGRISLRQLEVLLVETSGADVLVDRYGALLREIGDPRGDLIELDAALAEAPADARAHLERDRQALFRDCGPVLAPASLIEMAARAPRPETGLEVSLGRRSWLRWGRGFVRAAHVDVADCPGGRLQLVIDELLAHPAAMLLDELRIAPAPVRGVSYPDLIASLARRPPPLRRLAYGVLDAPAPIGWFSLGDLRRLWPALPHLRELSLEGDAPILGVIDLPELRRLTLAAGDLGEPAIADLAGSPLSRLEQLELIIGPRHRVGPAAIDALIDGLRRSPLRRLALAGLGPLGSDALASLARSPLLERLETLAIRGAELDATDASALVRNAGAFAHLERFELLDCDLDEAARAALAELAARLGALIVE